MPPEDAYDPPQQVRSLPSWLLGQASREAQRLVAEALAAEELRRQHYTVLVSLAEQGPASQAELGRRLWIDRSDLHAIAGELEARGLIERARAATDRRRNEVAITAAGEARLSELRTLVAKAQEQLLAPLNRAERRQLASLLQRLVPGA